MINAYKLSQDLEDSDHVWVWDNFQKTKPHAAHEQVVQEVLTHYLPDQNYFIQHSHNGRPELKTEGNKKIFINLSHSKNCLVLAISSKNELGVDIEQIKERKNWAKIVHRYFSPAEQTNCLEAIYRSWTAREAFIKAIGGRLFNHLPKIHVAVADPMAIGLDGQISHQVITHKIDQGYMLAICRPIGIKAPAKFFRADFLRAFFVAQGENV